MKWYKSFLFLFTLNLCLLAPIWLFFHISFLVPAFVFLLSLNLFLVFFSPLHLKTTDFSVFVPDDPYTVSKIFENLKTVSNIKNVQLLKTKNQTDYSFFAFSSGRKSFLVLSENFLDCFSKEDVKLLLSYSLKMIQKGDLSFLSLLSNFLFLMEKILYILNYPFSFMTKKSAKKEKENMVLILILKSLSFVTRKLYRNLDKSFTDQKKENKKWAYLIWKVDSLTTVCPPKKALFLAPLFLTNPLTHSQWKCYISLQPLIKDRVKSLGVMHPPEKAF